MMKKWIAILMTVMMVRMDGGDYDLSDISEFYTLLIAESYGDVTDRKLTIEVFSDYIEGKLA